MNDPLIEIALDTLDAHPANSNIMPAEPFGKLVAHLERSDRYPPVIVRPRGGGRYQLLDGHHRVAALRRLGREVARCVVWDVDDDEALLLLATLNRLRGRDDPRKRAALLSELSRRSDGRALSAKLPEGPEKLKRLLALHATDPAPRAPRPMEAMPVAVHFFLMPSQRERVFAALRATGGTHEEALLRWVAWAEAATRAPVAASPGSGASA